MGLKLYERKPESETVTRQTGRDVMLRMRGLDPRTTEEKRKDVEDAERVKRWIEKSGGVSDV